MVPHFPLPTSVTLSPIPPGIIQKFRSFFFSLLYSNLQIMILSDNNFLMFLVFSFILKNFYQQHFNVELLVLKVVLHIFDSESCKRFDAGC